MFSKFKLFSLFKKNSSSNTNTEPVIKEAKIEIPSWSPFSNPEHFYHFINEVKENIKDKGYELDVENGEMRMSVNIDGEEKIQRIFLSNLSKYCEGASIEEYKEMVSEFFQSMQKLYGDEAIEDKMIGLRIHTSKTMKMSDGDSFVGVEMLEGLYCVVVYDTDYGAKVARKKELDALNKSRAELFDIGFKNIQEKYPRELVHLEGNFFQVRDDSFYAPNILVDMPNNSNLIGRYGSLISPSNGIVTTILKIEGESIFGEIKTLSNMAVNLLYSEPNPITSNLYWYTPDGKYHCLFIDIENGKLQMPQEFAQLLSEIENHGSK